jgi:WD40 repeat protein
MAKLQHNGSVVAVAFSPDGRMLATGSSDNTTRLWDVATGKELQRLEHDGSVDVVAFSPDGGMLATGSGDNKARIWTLGVGKITEKACSYLMRNMTREEWSRFIDEQDCLTCPREGSFNRSSIWPWGRRECQPCIGNLG